jgi:hypothetical protein
VLQSILRGTSDTFPAFSNLKTLLFNGCDLSDDFEILGCFLNNSYSLEKLTLQYCEVFLFIYLCLSWSTMLHPLASLSFWQLAMNIFRCQKLPEGSKKRKRMQNLQRISVKCHDTLNFECPNLKLIIIKYKEDDARQLFGLLYGIWRNLRKTTIMLTEA